ncbi:MAG TPA: ATP-binding protein [Pyrinomonadaceae bacterium]|jgi:signal transduction histidine kinase
MVNTHGDLKRTDAGPLPLPPVDEGDNRILIVDDEQVIRSLFVSCLSRRYSCSAAANSDEALAYLNREPFALVISDVIMPGRSGVELLREINMRFPDTAVIMASGVDRTQRVLDAVRLGACDYLIKPCDLDTLEIAVERTLERRTLIRNARQYKADMEKRNLELKQSKAELERLQGQLVQNEKMASLGQLVAGIAHELNNPAGFIYGNMEILSQCAHGLERLLALYDEAPLPVETAAEVRKLKSELDFDHTLADLHLIIGDCLHGAERIRDVVQNLRLFSRLDEAELKKVDIHEGIESTIRLLSRYYTDGRIKLQRHYAALPLVDCYAGQLNQVWMNLLVNAAQAIGAHGEVLIKTQLDQQMVTITISDNGSGIAPEHLHSIFNPFFTTKPVGEGTGLGLSITYGIIERHGGSIRVKSRLGYGTTFIVALPMDVRKQTTPALDSCATTLSLY